MNLARHKKEIFENGFTVINNIFSTEQIQEISAMIESADSANSTFRRSTDLFAIRQFLKGIPKIQKIIIVDKVKNLIAELFGQNYFITKSIYFDKPAESNWFVAYHQDLTISVDKKLEIENFGPWTVKQNQFAVQPPFAFLQNNFTIRIHLDDADENNGALRVIPKSHLKGVQRTTAINKEKEVTCNTLSGGIMIMRPLLLHSSSRTTNNSRRRVVHIEFSDQELNNGLSWSERIDLT